MGSKWFRFTVGICIIVAFALMGWVFYPTIDKSGLVPAPVLPDGVIMVDQWSFDCEGTTVLKYTYMVMGSGGYLTLFKEPNKDFVVYLIWNMDHNLLGGWAAGREIKSIDDLLHSPCGYFKKS